MFIQETYKAAPLAANATYLFPQGAPTGLGGFICITAGTITVTRSDSTVLLNALPVSAGVYYPLPFFTQHNATVTLAGGASGTLLVI